MAHARMSTSCSAAGGHNQSRQPELRPVCNPMSATASCRASAPTVDGSRLPRRLRSTTSNRHARTARNWSRQVYLRDAIAGRTIRVTRALNRATPNGNSSLPAISADGRHVVFVSEASNLLVGDDNSTSDVFLYDRETGALSWVSRAADGQSAGGESTSPVISGDGRFVAFQSDAANLVCTRRPGCAALAGDFDDINLVWDVFVLDRELGRIVRASEDELGGWMEVSAAPGARLEWPAARVLVASPSRRDRSRRRLRSVRSLPDASTRHHAQVPVTRGQTGSDQGQTKVLAAHFLPIFVHAGGPQPRTAEPVNTLRELSHSMD